MIRDIEHFQPYCFLWYLSLAFAQLITVICNGIVRLGRSSLILIGKYSTRSSLRKSFVKLFYLIYVR